MSCNISVLPTAIPEQIVVDVSELEIGGSLRLVDVDGLEGVTFLDDPESTVLATVTAPIAEEELEAARRASEGVEGEEGAEGEEAGEGEAAGRRDSGGGTRRRRVASGGPASPIARAVALPPGGRSRQSRARATATRATTSAGARSS